MGEKGAVAGSGRPRSLEPGRGSGRCARDAVERIRVAVGGGRGYDIVIGTSIWERAGELLKAYPIGKHYYLVSDRKVYRLYGRRIEEALAGSGLALIGRSVLPAGEESKSLQMWEGVLDGVVRAEDGMQRRLVVVALGGGVVGDLAGFVAATYRRGTPYVQIPTTLIAQVDSSVGGKTAVNHPAGKNLIGAFHQPAAVLVDLRSLETLPLREVRSGLVEVIKYGVIEDERLFSYIERNLDGILACRHGPMRHIVERSCRIKARIVEEDEKEQRGIRTFLNLGHTVGHALEAATGYRRYRHGEAVGLGMLCASRIAVTLGRFSEKGYARIHALLARAGLPCAIRGVRLGEIWEAMKHDKKFIHGRNRFVLPAAIGKVEVVEDIDPAVIRESIESLLV
jgi:3-dehydroquinate synthase